MARAWKVTRVHPSIVRIDCDLASAKTRGVQWVLLRSDAHHDNPHSDHDHQRRDLDEGVKRGAIILDFGDLFCAMGGRGDNRRARHGTTREEHLDAPDYFDSLVKHNAAFIAPYAHSFAVIHQGNHETAVAKHQETDLTARLIERLNTMTGSDIHDGRYGSDMYFSISLGTHICSFWLHGFHGSGGGGMMSFDTLRCRRQASWNPVADVLVCGHVHERWVLELVRSVPSIDRHGGGMVELKPQFHVRCGCYKDEYGGDGKEKRASGATGWSVERGAPPKPMGAMWMKISIRRDQRNGRDFVRPHLEFIAT